MYEKYIAWNLNIFVVVACFLAMKVYGQCSTTTRPYLVDATQLPQYITSPNYPSDYPVNQSCAWMLTAPSPTTRIIINIEDLETEGSTLPCKYDYLAVFDGGSNSSTEIAKLCNANRDSINVLVSSTDTLYVTFVSDHRFNYKGFRMLVFTNDTDSQADCGSTLVATSESQVLMSTNLPELYQSDFSCGIKIKPDTQFYAVKLDMYFMDIELSTDCANDSLQIISVDGSTTTEELVQCTRATTYDFTQFPIEVTGDYALLNFSTDSANNFYGFLLTYEEVRKGINLTRPSNGSTTTLKFREDQPTGHLNTSVAVIELTYTGSLQLQIFPSYEVTSGQTVSLRDDVQIFAFTEEAPYVYLDLISSFDFETINKFSLLVTLVDTDVFELTYSLTFNITINDVDDVAPTFLSLPSNITLMRNQNAGELLHTVNSTDYDFSVQFRNVIYQIFDGDLDSMFTINATSGEIKLSRNANLIPLTTSEYSLIIAAYSGTSTASTLAEFSTFTVYVNPDSPPECSHDNVWAKMLDLNMVGYGSQIMLSDTWRCIDDNVNISYTIESVSPNMTSQLFEIDPKSGALSLLRTFAPAEVPMRLLVVEIGATDTVQQMVTFTVSINVTALSCLPNPRPLYVRMDKELGGVLLSDFNCTMRYGMSYTLDQYPDGTFEVDDSVNGTAKLILRKSVVKIKFYGLSITITDGLDMAVLDFKVFVQTARCGIHKTSGVPGRIDFIQAITVRTMLLLIVWVLRHA